MRVAVVGLGHWGPNVARAVAANDRCELVALVDRVPERISSMESELGEVEVVTESLVHVPYEAYDAVVVCTPAPTHAELVRDALARGRHVLVEKPLALDGETARRLRTLAADQGCVLMTDHQMLYSPVVRHWRKMLRNEEFGDVLHVDARRTNMGIVRRTESPVWSLGPHDVAMAVELFGPPDRVSARGYWMLNGQFPDAVDAVLEYGTVAATFRWSWFDLERQRIVRIIGSQRTAVWAENSYMQYVMRNLDQPRPEAEWEDAVPLEKGKQLDAAVADFAHAVLDGATPVSDVDLAVEVVQVLEALEGSVDWQRKRAAVQRS